MNQRKAIEKINEDAARAIKKIKEEVLRDIKLALEKSIKAQMVLEKAGKD